METVCYYVVDELFEISNLINGMYNFQKNWNKSKWKWFFAHSLETVGRMTIFLHLFSIKEIKVGRMILSKWIQQISMKFRIFIQIVGDINKRKKKLSLWVKDETIGTKFTVTELHGWFHLK